jgi:hypothetical protein
MVEEIESFHMNETWYFVELPNGRKLIITKWVFKSKFNAIDQVKKYKDRLVVKGYSQVEGFEFGDIFSPIEKLAAIRVMMSLATKFDLKIEKMNVNTTFLHGDLEEEIYMK